MKATIKENGTLILIAENELEAFAVKQWNELWVNPSHHPAIGHDLETYKKETE